MTKNLQDLVWRSLPKEFKEEVKDDYKELVSALDYFQNKISLNNEECDRCDLIREKRAIYNKYFSHHNLTSDAEEEEMLTVSRKRVQEIYSYNEEILSQDQTHSGAILLKKKLTDLFGSKCLLDELPLKITAAEACIAMAKQDIKDESAKFKIGDKVIFKNTGKVKVIAKIYDYNRYVITTINGQSSLCVEEDEIEIV